MWFFPAACIRLNQDETYDVEELRRFAAERGGCAYGEKPGLGLIFTRRKQRCAKQESFIHHIQIGRELQKPVIVHTRDARADTLSILREEKSDGLWRRTTLFYRGQRNRRANYWTLDSISRFPASSRSEMQSSSVMLPAMFLWTGYWSRRILLTLRLYRIVEKENQPAMTRDVAEYMAVVKGVAVEELAQATTDTLPACFTSTLLACNLFVN
ncbi:putative metallodependent hydrolase [Citrobacter freundii]|nr:putative metallodependent hydrolase [Citrobacter freundii]